MILGARLIHIGSFGTAMPITDAWSAEGELYLKADRGTLSWQDLVAPHNEHRVAFTRLLDLALLAGNGQWDNRLQCVAGAALHAAIGALLSWVAWRLGGRRIGLAAAGLAVVVFALPYSMNDLYGFNSQYDFVVFFGILTIALAGLSRPLRPAWWAGLLAGFCGLFTAGSGVLAAAALGAVALLGWVTGTWRARETVIHLAGSVLMLGVGIALTVTVPGHAVLRAHTAGEFLRSFVKAAALMHPHMSAVVAVVIWLPLLLVLRERLRRGAERPGLGLLVVGLGVWLALQAAAVSYSRGANGGGPDRRHLDVLFPALFVNGVGVALLFENGRRRAGAPWRCRIALSAWALCAAWVAVRQGVDVLRDVSPAQRDWFAERERNLRAFVVTGGEVSLEGKEIPFPEWGRNLLAGYLTEPRLRRLLPAELREPLTLVPSAPSPAFDVRRGLPDPALITSLRWWTSFAPEPQPGPIRFESAPLTARLPFLRFDLAGHPGENGNTLEVVAASGRCAAVFSPKVFGEVPRSADVRAPSGPFLVRADSPGRGPRGWFAFSDPVEVGRLSRMASVAASNGVLVAAAGVILALALLGLEWRRGRPPEATG